MYIIADTNVVIVANGKSSQASVECVINCVRRLREIQPNEILVLDDGWLIIQEYQKKLSSSGQPGVGDAFLKWLLTNQYNPQRCERIQITAISEYNFVEFPNDPNLDGFDLSDCQFVAVAIAHPDKPPILNAVDSDWRDFSDQLATHEV
ncbi:hypothetical protein [Arthrospira platensis]|uniref:PIN domain-containing protein n=1 Tax=Limnospira platensis NIES-46 TaxID=1236695 RepID=A0A5M3T1K5_LIMPL|nr:hypothetical protein [Arthrospira platensis]AMW30121.1 hypothetical protein AP285_21535 [Arthrospira platensis YZ]KDR54069.1 hypothetical protein APPUASWS_031490 [Arthrospira platensis str. Paraca]MBD2669714.1 hypothetical protein [Arthrospira platensis FACHB-439]MBD2709109.1 hypothetical protein [Arthrospira platensis FACHB-835]MDF2207989.1 hypothetical protein [Arthrospira platensis NCB002]MDT9182325.1 hypothetical protein [Limnospira sp. PMC 289.06]MDT9294532.1 hypothetical protein [Ar